MTAVLELPPGIAYPDAQYPHRSAHALRPVAPSVGPLTEGLARVLGQGLPMPSQSPPQIPAAASPTAGLSGMTVDSLLQSMPQAPAPLESAASLETLRMEMFGRYYEELEGRMKELRTVVEGGVTRARKAMLDRVDELGSALHRDMVSLRQEMQKELEDLKRDVFTTVMGVSAINDKIGLSESRNRETWIAVTKALSDRIDQQAKTNADALERFRSGADESLDHRVVKVVEGTLMKLAAARRTENAARPLEAHVA
jgi:hypothetical protein